MNDSQSEESYIKGRVALKRHQLKELVSESCTKGCTEGRYELIKKVLRTEKTLFFSLVVHFMFKVSTSKMFCFAFLIVILIANYYSRGHCSFCYSNIETYKCAVIKYPGDKVSFLHDIKIMVTEKDIFR